MILFGSVVLLNLAWFGCLVWSGSAGCLVWRGCAIWFGVVVLFGLTHLLFTLVFACCYCYIFFNAGAVACLLAGV